MRRISVEKYYVWKEMAKRHKIVKKAEQNLVVTKFFFYQNKLKLTPE